MKRDKSIDFLMFLAVFFVVNSHIEMMYPDSLRFLSTGGVIGDALFFFCSGYKLALGRLDRFDFWYKRRIARIYPTVMVWGVASALLFSLPLTCGRLFGDGYWFVKCIMVHYIGLYLIYKYFSRWLWLVWGSVWGGVVAWWCLSYSPRFAIGMLGSSKFEWYYLFAFTLLGGMLARGPSLRIKTSCAVTCVMSAFAVHYGWLAFVNRFPSLLPVRVLLLLPLLAVIFSLFLFSKSGFAISLMERKWLGRAILFMGGLCLEVYMSHITFRTARFNGLFPLNLIGFFVAIFILAYLLRCLTRFVLQTVGSQKYDYREIFKMI